MTETDQTLIATYPTRAGSLVTVHTVTAVRVRSMSDIDGLEGPIWHCNGCEEGSDQPLTNTFFGNPVALVRQAAAGHANFCRR